MIATLDKTPIGGRVVSGYVGRFAPSPTGPLHTGSLVAALASYLDARAANGRWLVRMEDVDRPRTVAGAADLILHALECCGMRSDEPVVYQSGRSDLCTEAFAWLGLRCYPCGCSRKEIADSVANSTGEHRSTISPTSDQASSVICPGTCRNGMAAGKTGATWRIRVPMPGNADDRIVFRDRALGEQTRYLSNDTGDFVIRRADQLWVYQLAVVVDDADQGVTHVVRGEDLLESTTRQIFLQKSLGLPTPTYLHTPLVYRADGNKLSKQNGARAIDTNCAVNGLTAAADILGLALSRIATIADFWQQAVPMWSARYPPD